MGGSSQSGGVRQSGRRRPRAVPASCGGSAGGPSDAAVCLASPPGRCGPRQRARASARPRRASSGPICAASSRGLLLAATRRLSAPSSQEVFFVAQASRGKVGLGAEVVTMVQCAPRAMPSQKSKLESLQDASSKGVITELCVQARRLRHPWERLAKLCGARGSRERLQT